MIRGGAHMGGVVVASGGEEVARVLVPVYEALELDWDPATSGSVSEEIGREVDPSELEEVLIAQLARRYELVTLDSTRRRSKAAPEFGGVGHGGISGPWLMEQPRHPPQGVRTRSPPRFRPGWTGSPGGRWHWRVVIALGITWIIDGLEVTLVVVIGGVLGQPETLRFRPRAQIGL